MLLIIFTLCSLLGSAAWLLAWSQRLRLATLALAHHLGVVGAEERWWSDEPGRHGREQAPALALPHCQLSGRQEESGTVLRRAQLGLSVVGLELSFEAVTAAAAAADEEAEHARAPKKAAPPLLFLLVQRLLSLLQAEAIC